MENGTYFFLIFVATIVITRIVLLPNRLHSPTVLGFRLHHYMYGLVLMVLSWIISNVFILAVGLGFFVDELPHILFSRTFFFSVKTYYSHKMMLGVVFFILLAFLFRNQIVSVI